MHLVISRAARADLKAIARYTRRKWTASQAKTYLAMIAGRFVLLARRPSLGLQREDVALGYRSLPVGRHLIFNRRVDEKIVIIRILHQSMDATRRLQAISAKLRRLDRLARNHAVIVRHGGDIARVRALCIPPFCRSGAG